MSTLTQLDLETARRVMGWHYSFAPCCTLCGVSHRALWSAAEAGQVRGKVIDFRPSSDIASAMLVVEKMAQCDFQLRRLACWMARFQNVVNGIEGGYTADSPSVLPARVICLAALEYVAALDATKENQ